MRNLTTARGPSPVVMSVKEIEAAVDEVIARVEAGETVIVERDGRAVARLKPPRSSMHHEQSREMTIDG